MRHDSIDPGSAPGPELPPEFGPRRCARCRAPIPASRLRIVPTARYCVTCESYVAGEQDDTLRTP